MFLTSLLPEVHPKPPKGLFKNRVNEGVWTSSFAISDDKKRNKKTKQVESIASLPAQPRVAGGVC